MDDDGKSVKIGFGTTLPDRVAKGTPGETTVNITDDDHPDVSVSFEQATYTVAEGSSVTVKVKLSADPERQVVIPLTKVNQDGASGEDYSGVPASVTFDSGDTEQTFSFTAATDSNNDDGESVRLAFGTTLPARVSAGTPARTTYSITDDDVPQVSVSFENASYAVAETDDPDTADEEEHKVAIKVSLSADPERTVTIPLIKAHQDGASVADYSGVPLGATFNSGDTEYTFTLTATGDDIDDDGEKVKLTFGALPTGVSAGTNASAAVTITDDDTAGVTVTPTSLSIDEGESGEYSVVLDSQPAGTVTIALSGTTGTDVETNPASLEFTTSGWKTAQKVTVSAAQDTDAEDDAVTIVHTVTSTGDSKYHEISTASVAITVDDDETAATELTLTMPDPVHWDVNTDGKVNLGDTLAYTATATNSGNLPLTAVNVSDLLIDTAGQDCAALAIGATCVLAGSHTVTQAQVNAGKIINTATASATGAQTKTLTRETAVDQARALTLEKTSTASGFDEVDDTIPYSYKVINAGTVTLTGTLEIEDDRLPSGINCPDVPDAGLAPD